MTEQGWHRDYSLGKEVESEVIAFSQPIIY